MGDSPVMPSTFATLSVNSAKHLAAQRNRPFAEFTLSGANVLRVTVKGLISLSELFIETA